MRVVVDLWPLGLWLIDCDFGCLCCGCGACVYDFALFVGLLFVLYTSGFCFVGGGALWVWFAVGCVGCGWLVLGVDLVVRGAGLCLVIVLLFSAL